MDSGSPDPAATLRRVGLRVTVSRLAVHTALPASAPHASVDAVASAVRERLGDGSAQTVYSVLRTLTDAELVRGSVPAGWPGLDELRAGDYRHHSGCHRRDASADGDGVVGDTACLTAAGSSWGQCPACVAATSVSSGESQGTRSVRHQLGDIAVNAVQSRLRATSHQQETLRKEKDQRG